MRARRQRGNVSFGWKADIRKGVNLRLPGNLIGRTRSNCHAVQFDVAHGRGIPTRTACRLDAPVVEGLGKGAE
jgi:hypothetical protein